MPGNKTLAEIYAANPITTIADSDLVYVSRGATDAGITGENILIQTLGNASFPVSKYGAVGDGRIKYDGATTSGSPTLTSATAAFTAADVGRTVIFEHSPTSRQIATVSAYVSATSVTLSANASATTSAATFVIGTDDTAAVQAAIDAAYTAMGGIVQFDVGIYVLTGALQDTGTRNAVLLFPNPDQDDDENIRTIELHGAYPATAGYSGFFAYRAGENGTVLYFGTHGSGALPCAISGNAATGFTSINAVFTNLDFRFPQNSTIGGLNFSNGGGFEWRDCSAATLRGTADTWSVPSTTTKFLHLPGNSNNSLVRLDGISVTGFGVGMHAAEHVYLSRAMIFSCGVGLYIDDGWGVWVHGLHFIANTKDIQVDQAASYPTFGGLGVEFEDVGGGVTTHNIDDAGGKLWGRVQYSANAPLKNFNSFKMEMFGAGRSANSFSNQPYISYGTDGISLKAANDSSQTKFKFYSSTGALLGFIAGSEGSGGEFIFQTGPGIPGLLRNDEGEGITIHPTTGKATIPLLRVSSIPTSASGLSSGDVWSDGGTLKIVT